MSVEYRPIAGCLGYRVGDDGSVWSLWQKEFLGSRNGCRSFIGTDWNRMKLRTNGDGYAEVGLKTSSGKQRTFRVQRLVLEAFVGPCPDGMEACHGPDHNRANCRLANLRWDTHARNIGDKYARDTIQRGEKHGAHKLTAISVREIRALSRLRIFKQKELAKAYGVCIQCIEAVCQRRAWKHVA